LFAFLPVSLTALKPIDRRGEKITVPAGTLGAALRERRWTLKLDQREAAERVGVALSTYARWELNECEPDLRHIPPTVSFLGYDWRPAPVTFGEKLRAARTRLGISAEELAKLLGFRALETVRWHEERSPKRRTVARRILEAWLETSRNEALNV
jgi:transcriptional regulator with XRE-family HTH domain